MRFSSTVIYKFSAENNKLHVLFMFLLLSNESEKLSRAAVQSVCCIRKGRSLKHHIRYIQGGSENMLLILDE